MGWASAHEQDTRIGGLTLGKLRGRPYLLESPSEGEGMTRSKWKLHVNGRKKVNVKDQPAASH